jgi:hypothetical protein
MKWGGQGWVDRAAEGLRKSERKSEASEPTIGMLFAMVVAGGGGASERASGASEQV